MQMPFSKRVRKKRGAVRAGAASIEAISPMHPSVLGWGGYRDLCVEMEACVSFFANFWVPFLKRDHALQAQRLTDPCTC